ncbi:MAG: hypothetical protein O7B30_03050 [Thaumarchaeota archaeon]|nr:hypothetical protein [Nitrososphaerota archaeon]
MPKLIYSLDEFKEISKRADELRVVRKKDRVKLKLSTKGMLYVYITTEEEGESLIKELKIPHIEL